MKSNSTTSKQWISTLVLSLLSMGGYAQVTDKLKMVWNDEFNGNSLDLKKWSPAPEWPRQGGCRWSHKNFDMTGKGQVRLQVTEQNNSVLCGAIRTRNLFDKKYGYFEVRCTVPEIHGGWGAFWLMPLSNKPGNLGNDGTEIDVFESINGWRGKINHALHWDGYSEEHHKKDSFILDRPDLYDGKYHVFGMMWTPKEYIFYIDNKETWRTTSGEVSDVNQYLKLTLEVSDGSWAGNWKNQVKKPIDWLIDYVRVYDYQPIKVNLRFFSLTDGQSFFVGDKVHMHVDVSGSLSQIDEIRFTTQKGDEADISQKISKIIGETTTYLFNWFPNKPGSYKLEALGYKSETYVTNVVINVIVIDNLGPAKVAFSSLKSGAKYTTGEKVKMDVILTGNLLQVDHIQYLTKLGDGEFAIQKTEKLENELVYSFNWTPTVAGTYILRVTALKDGKYVTHVVAGDIKVEEDLNPLSLQFVTLSSGTTYQTSNPIPMHIELSGDLSDADEIRFMTKMADDDFIVQNTVNVLNANLWYNWSPTEAGKYVLRATAYKNNSYITHVVVNDIVVEDPLTLKYTSLQSGMVYKVGAKVKMHVQLSGDYANINLIKFISKRKGGSVSVLKKLKVSGAKALYRNKWKPFAAGKYKLTVIAYNSGSKVAYTIADITVKERGSY